MTSRAPSALALVAAVSLGLGACGGSTRRAESSASSPGVDSADVRLVTSVTPLWANGGGWTVDSIPSLELGEDGGRAAAFSSVAAAARFPDGRIVVADEATGELLVFDPDGRLVNRIAPSKADSSSGVGSSRVWAVPPDTIVALDEADQVRWLTTGGLLVREDSLPPPDEGSWDELALLDDGTFVGTLGVSASQIDAGTGGLQRVPTPLIRVDPRTKRSQTLGMLPGLELFARAMGGRTMLGIPPLGRRTLVRADGGLILVGTDEGMSYDLRRTDGTVVRRVRIEGYDLSGADTMAARILDQRLKNVEDPAVRAFMRQTMGQIPVPRERPAYADVLVSADGHVWLGKHRGPPPQMPPDDWEVFDPEGRWLGTVRTPTGFRVLDVGDADVLGTTREGRAVEVLRIEKRAAS